MCACNETDELPTQQMGRVEVRLVAPYRAATRATGDWLDPVDSKEKIHQWWVAFANNTRWSTTKAAMSAGRAQRMPTPPMPTTLLSLRYAQSASAGTWSA